MVFKAACLLAILFNANAMADTYSVTLDAKLSRAKPFEPYFLISGDLPGLITAGARGGNLSQDPSGCLTIPIEWSGPLTIDFSIRYVNDLSGTMRLVNIRPSGFYSTIGPESVLNDPVPASNRGAFAYEFTMADPQTLTLAPGGSFTTPFFRYTLRGSFGPEIEAVDTESGWIYPAYELQAGDMSRFGWDVVADQITDPVPEPGSASALATGFAAVAWFLRWRRR